MTRAVLILRPEPAAQETASRARARGLEPVVAPLFSIRALEWAAPSADRFDAILFTSANAPRHGGEALAAFRRLPCYAVGEATALAAAEAGFGHVRTGPSDGAAVVEMMARDGIGRAFHPTGADTSALPQAGIAIEQVPVYASEAADRLSDVAVAAIHAGAIVLLHSPRSAEAFAERIGERRAQTRIAAISDAAAAAAGPGWAGVGVALEPRDDALLIAAEELADMAAGETGAPPGNIVPVTRGLPVQRRRPWLQPLLVGLAAFLFGLAAMAWLLVRWDTGASYLGLAPAQPVEAQSDTSLGSGRPLLMPGAAVNPTDPELARRLALLEQRLSELNLDAREAVGNVDRAEGLLVAFAARRALERGVGLGYLDSLLRQRFGDTQPEAVSIVIEFSLAPVTAQQLQLGLRELAPRLTGAAPGQSFWQALGNEIANLLVVRSEGTRSTDPRERLARAMARLEAGQVEEALQEVLRMPGRENARAWIDAAQRYVAARQALDTIELAAFAEPRMPQRQAVPAIAPDAVPEPAAAPPAAARPVPAR